MKRMRHLLGGLLLGAISGSIPGAIIGWHIDTLNHALHGGGFLDFGPSFAAVVSAIIGAVLGGLAGGVTGFSFSRPRNGALIGAGFSVVLVGILLGNMLDGLGMYMLLLHTIANAGVGALVARLVNESVYSTFTS